MGYLILSLKKNEGAWVGNHIHVTVVESTKDQVRIGIDAPGDVKVLRDKFVEEGDGHVHNTRQI